VLLLASALSGPATAQERVDEAVIARIKTESFQHSQVMKTLSWLCDVHGPRLTGSPGFKAASEWARGQLAKWGLVNARLEPWGKFGPGWSVERFSVEMTEPRYTRLIAYPHAWTPGTNGVVKGTPTLVEISSKDDFPKYKGKLKNAIVLFGKPTAQASRFEAPARRATAEQLTRGERAIDPGEPKDYFAAVDSFKKFTDKQREIVEFLRNEGIAVLLEPSVRDDNVIEVAGIGYFLGTDPYFPSFVVGKEQYGRMVRLLDLKIPVTLEISLTTKFYKEDGPSTNVIAEIPGTDPKLADQLVMLGGHLDSWDSGTGAEDNGAGSAVVLEVARILKTIGAQPRRTVRVALWAGEEEGYFGSTGYVKQHFGDPDTMELKPEQAKVSGYFNLDNGSGRIRGVNLQGNEAVRPIFEAYLKPFQYLEASTLTVRNTGGTDHVLFNAVGIPGFQFIQDPLDYGTRRHHTNIDVYEGAIEEDLKQAAAIMASFVYHAAMRDEMLPRTPLPQPRPKENVSAEAGK
jgi:hypothetical protein